MRVFLSHLSSDSEFAARLASVIRAEGHVVDTYRELISPGESITERIGSALQAADSVVVLLSQGSMANQWVSSEISMAVSRRLQSGRPRLIPILVDDEAEIPFFMRDLLYVDMSTPEKYESSLPGLIRALEETPAAPDLRAREEMLRAARQSLALEVEQYHQAAGVRSLSFSRWLSAAVGIVGVAAGLAAVLAALLGSTRGALIGGIGGLLAGLLYSVLTLRLWMERSAVNAIRHIGDLTRSGRSQGDGE